MSEFTITTAADTLTLYCENKFQLSAAIEFAELGKLEYTYAGPELTITHVAGQSMQALEADLRDYLEGQE